MSQIGKTSSVSDVDDGAVINVLEEEAEFDDKDDADAVADVKEELALGRCSSGAMVVRRVSHESSSGLKLRSLSPRPSTYTLARRDTRAFS